MEKTNSFFFFTVKKADRAINEVTKGRKIEIICVVKNEQGAGEGK